MASTPFVERLCPHDVRGISYPGKIVLQPIPQGVVPGSWWGFKSWMLNDQDSTGLGASGTCKRQEQSEREVMKVMTMPLVVTPDQRQGREFVRREIVRHVEQGMTATEAQRLCPVPLHRTTVYRLLKRVEREGEQALAEQRHGHPVKLRGEALTFLLDYCQSHPAITSREVQKLLTERFGLSVSVSQLNRVRATHGLSRNAPKLRKKAANECYHCLWIS
jgi:transposase